MDASYTTVPTVGCIATRLRVPVHRIRYLIESRSIAPIGRAGNSRIFSEAAVELIQSELARIERAKVVGHGV